MYRADTHCLSFLPARAALIARRADSLMAEWFAEAVSEAVSQNCCCKSSIKIGTTSDADAGLSNLCSTSGGWGMCSLLYPE